MTILVVVYAPSRIVRQANPFETPHIERSLCRPEPIEIEVCLCQSDFTASRERSLPDRHIGQYLPVKLESASFRILVYNVVKILWQIVALGAAASSL